MAIYNSVHCQFKDFYSCWRLCAICNCLSLYLCSLDSADPSAILKFIVIEQWINSLERNLPAGDKLWRARNDWNSNQRYKSFIRTKRLMLAIGFKFQHARPRKPQTRNTHEMICESIIPFSCCLPQYICNNAHALYTYDLWMKWREWLMFRAQQYGIYYRFAGQSRRAQPVGAQRQHLMWAKKDLVAWNNQIFLRSQSTLIRSTRAGIFGINDSIIPFAPPNEYIQL